ncbi:hypothetical protein [Pseudonocardia endophytica]|uniref:hypothetical protein n=1 Tax=Pseudonocardia endophytica TaxID=401976 RepID=UPI00104E7EBE|nr:hypothetical protein [Pseudonocardia endophytica]
MSTVLGLLDALLDHDTAVAATIRVYEQLWRHAPEFNPRHQSAYNDLIRQARRAAARPLTHRLRPTASMVPAAPAADPPHRARRRLRDLAAATTRSVRSSPVVRGVTAAVTDRIRRMLEQASSKRRTNE